MSVLEKLIAQVNSLDDLSSRKVSALVGAIVGDAACLHLEWIYDQDKVLKIVHPPSREPAFWPENARQRTEKAKIKWKKYHWWNAVTDPW